MIHFDLPSIDCVHDPPSKCVEDALALPAGKPGTVKSKWLEGLVKTQPLRGVVELARQPNAFVPATWKIVQPGP